MECVQISSLPRRIVGAVAWLVGRANDARKVVVCRSALSARRPLAMRLASTPKTIPNIAAPAATLVQTNSVVSTALVLVAPI
jgi:hypothetical protein